MSWYHIVLCPLALAGGAALALATTVVPSVQGVELPERRLLPLASADSLLATSSGSAPVPSGPLTLAGARRLALQYNPSLASFAWRVRASVALTADAARRPNPVAEATVENLGGGAGAGRSEVTLSVEQTLELGGDRAARADVAGAGVTLAARELEVEQRGVLARVTDIFVSAWWAQERLARLVETASLAVEGVAAATERVHAGGSPPLERVRAETNLALRQSERRRAEAVLAVTRQRLALEVGAGAVSFGPLVLDLEPLAVLPDVERLVARLAPSPEARRAEAEVALERARVGAAQAERTPDLSVHAGARRLQELGATGLVAGVSLPVRLWNADRGRLRAAEAELAGAAARSRTVRRRLEQELRAAHTELVAAADAIDTARAQVLPSAREALSLLRAGYRAGRFSYLELLDGQRAALEAELLVLDSTRDGWAARAVLERVLGEPLESFTVPEEGK